MERKAGVALSVCGLLVGTVAGFGAGVLEGFLVPYRIGAVRLPVAIVVAIVANVGIALWTRHATGSKVAPLAPAIAWFGAIALLGTRTAEGDLVIVGNDWMGLGTVFVGAIAFAVGLFAAARPDRLPKGDAPVEVDRPAPRP